MKKSIKEIWQTAKKRGFIEENEINLLTKRYKEKQIKDIIFSVPFEISFKQTTKGYTWLMNRWKTPAGRIRKHNPFSCSQENALINFKKFQFIGYKNNNNQLYPIYRTIANNINVPFNYYIKNYQINFFIM